MKKEKLPMAFDKLKSEVVSPLGEKTDQIVPHLAPRLKSLEGKTICEIWNKDFRGDETFPFIREMLRERYPGLKVIPFHRAPYHRGSGMGPASEGKDSRSREGTALVAKGCDAVITGNGA